MSEIKYLDPEQANSIPSIKQQFRFVKKALEDGQTIPDIDQIRANAAKGATAYQKPSGGIPASDLNSTVRNALSKAEGAVSVPGEPGTVGQVLQLDAQGNPAWVTPSAGTVPDAELDETSTNAIQNKVITEELLLGAAYDVSAKNPKAGPNNDGKWETLSALLSDTNLNTLIPTAVRKGGMSVKYVQSSDNKYVQFRYMGTDVTGTPNPFLDTANWQGVDNEPETGSNNLIKSGGVVDYVYKRVFSTENSVKNIQDKLEIGSISGLGSNSWTYSSSTTRIRTKQGQSIPLSKGDIVRLTTYEGVAMFVGCEGDYTKGSQGWISRDFVVQSDGLYAILLHNIPTEETVTMEGLGSIVEVVGKSLGDAAYKDIDSTPIYGSHNLVESGGVYQKISDIENKVFGVVNISNFDFIDKSFNKNTLEYVYLSTNYHATPKIDVTGYDKISFTGSFQVDSDYPSLCVIGDGALIFTESTDGECDLSPYSQYSKLEIVINAKVSDSMTLTAYVTNNLKDNILGESNYRFNKCKEYTFVGNDSTAVTEQIVLNPNSRYTLWIDKITALQSNLRILGVYYTSGGQNTYILEKTTSTHNSLHYDFVTPYDITDYTILVRGENGEKINIFISPRADFTGEPVFCIPSGLEFVDTTSVHTVAWTSLIIRIGEESYTLGEGSYNYNPILVYNKKTGEIQQIASITQITEDHVLLIYYKDSKVVDGLLYGYVTESGNINDDVFIIPTNIRFSNYTVAWDNLNVYVGKTKYTIQASSYDLSSNRYLTLNTKTGVVSHINTINDLNDNDVVLLYNNATYGICYGYLFDFYIEQRENSCKNVNQLILFKKANQMRELVWIPKATVIANEGTHLADVPVTGTPYSSVKECQKFIGLDVSIHTFMTAVNNIHSLFYTERVSEINSQSAYGITYHGINCDCYYGNVCSAYVSAALGYQIQYDSWAWCGYYFDKFNELETQNAENIKVGDVLWEPGHCSVITKIERNYDGSIKRITIDEQDARTVANPVTRTVTGVFNIEQRRKSAMGLWCNVKSISHNVDYSPSPFILFTDETLYSNLYNRFVFIDSDNGRTYYSCKTANSDNTFTSSKWDIVPTYDNSISYDANIYVSHGEELYRSKKYSNTETLSNKEAWELVKGVHEWEAYPFVYNDDIVTFAGDRAVFKNNDLIYINYVKGNYTQMELYKDGILTRTINLSSDSSVYQVDVSSYCSNAGMYRARLTDGTNKSRYTYFEVVDTNISVISNNGIYGISFSSANGEALEVKVVNISGYPMARLPLTDKDKENGMVVLNADALSAAQLQGKFGKSYENEELFVVVTFAGQWGNVTTEKTSIGNHTTIGGTNVYPGILADLGIIDDGRNIFLAGRLKGNTFMFSFSAESSVSVNVLATTDELKWVSEIPSELVSGKTYIVTINNGIGDVAVL